MSALAAVSFDAPLVNPAPNGLFSAVTWSAEDGPPRWLGPGVDFRVFNYGGDAAHGVWTAAWDVASGDLDPGDVKDGERPGFPDTFTAMTTFGYDEGNLAKWSQSEVRTRAAQNLRLLEPNTVETTFAVRLLADTTAAAVADIVAAVSVLDAELAKTNTVGVIHAGAHWAAYAANASLVVRSGAGLKTPLGNQWVFGGGYVGALDSELVATSPLFGWRNDVIVRDAVKMEHNKYAAIAERSLVIGYEAAVAAVDITP